MKAALATGLLILAGIFESQASLAQWTFEASQPDADNTSAVGPFLAEGGIFASSSMASGYHSDSRTDYSHPMGAGSEYSFSANYWSSGDYYQFTTSTLGYTDVNVTFKAASSSTGPQNFDLAYSTDGANFFVSSSYSVRAYGSPNWSATLSAVSQALFAFSFDLSSIAELDDQPIIYLRLIDHDAAAAGGGTVASTGASRVDDFTILANPRVTSVPEPATFLAGALLSLPLALQGFRRLRKSRSF